MEGRLWQGGALVALAWDGRGHGGLGDGSRAAMRTIEQTAFTLTVIIGGRTEPAFETMAGITVKVEHDHVTPM